MADKADRRAAIRKVAYAVIYVTIIIAIPALPARGLALLGGCVKGFSLGMGGTAAQILKEEAHKSLKEVPGKIWDALNPFN
jgi:hypothetical protein